MFMSKSLILNRIVFLNYEALWWPLLNRSFFFFNSKMQLINQREILKAERFIPRTFIHQKQKLICFFKVLFSIAQKFAEKQYCYCLKANFFELFKGSRAQLKQTLTTIMVARFSFFFFQLISSKAVAEVSCSSCVSLFFSDVDC